MLIYFYPRMDMQLVQWLATWNEKLAEFKLQSIFLHSISQKRKKKTLGKGMNPLSNYRFNNRRDRALWGSVFEKDLSHFKIMPHEAVQRGLDMGHIL